MTCGRDLPAPEPSLPVIFDLDGVLVRSVWPQPGIGPTISEGLALLRHYAEEGYAIEIWSARPIWDQPLVEQWAREMRLPVSRVVTGHKPMGSLYWDDRAARFPPDGGKLESRNE